jgi:hypothetical protein
MGWRHPEHCLTSRRFTICRIDTIHFITGPVGVYYSKDSKERGRDGRRAGSARDSIQIPHTRFWSIFRGVFGRSSLLVAEWLALAYYCLLLLDGVVLLFWRGVFMREIFEGWKPRVARRFSGVGESESMSTSMSELSKSFMSWSCLNA